MKPVNFRTLLFVFACALATGCGADALSVGDDSISRDDFEDYASVLGYLDQGPGPVEEVRLDANWARFAAAQWLTTSAFEQALADAGFEATDDDSAEAATVVLDATNRVRNDVAAAGIDIVSTVEDFDQSDPAFAQLTRLVTTQLVADRAGSAMADVEVAVLELMEDAEVESRIGRWDNDVFDVVPR